MIYAFETEDIHRIQGAEAAQMEYRCDNQYNKTFAYSSSKYNM
jgi:hypothetical protein